MNLLTPAQLLGGVPPSPTGKVKTTSGKAKPNGKQKHTGKPNSVDATTENAKDKQNKTKKRNNKKNKKKIHKKGTDGVVATVDSAETTNKTTSKRY